MVKIFGHHVPMWAPVVLVADVLLCFVAVLLADASVPLTEVGRRREGVPSADVLLWAATFAAFMALLYAFVGLYRQGATHVSMPTQVGRGLFALSIGLCIGYAALEAEGRQDHAFLLLLYSMPVMVVGGFATRGIGYVARRRAVGARRVLIVGTGSEARRVAAELAIGGSSRHVIVGFYRPRLQETPAISDEHFSAPVFPTGVSVDDIVRKHRVDEVIVAVREQRGGGVPMDELLACRIRGVSVLDWAGFFERVRGEVPTDSLKASWLVYGHGFVQGRLRTTIKRTFDIAVSSLLLVLGAPIMVCTAIAIKLESRGPVFYHQERVGLHGRGFMCRKFRSMGVDAEKDGVARWATKNDARVTRVGAFIRKCRIDELPQLISVLRGEMSLVGPRPERASFVEQLQLVIPFYSIRHSVKPGVTGWAQVRYGYGATVEDARRKHQFDLYYLKNHSLSLDMLVLIETVSVVLFREGAQ